MSEHDADTDLSYIPPGYRAVAPYLCVRGAAEAIDWYTEVFGASEVGERFVDPEGKVGHAELKLGDSHVYLADEYPGYGMSPVDLPDSTVSIYIHVPDVDAVAKQAGSKGATMLQPVEETFYGARRCTLRDPFGHRWMVSTHVREVSDEEYQKARDEFSEHGV